MLREFSSWRCAIWLTIRSRSCSSSGRNVSVSMALMLQPPFGCSRDSRPLAVADSSRRSASSGAMPARLTTLSRAPWPETIATSRCGSSSVSASSRTTASFARPSSGGAATRTFQASPWRPTIAGA